MEQGRQAQLERLGNETFDALVLGGGITGVAAAHVLVRRGYRVALIDSHDFASGTSQESSQLIWGGIKYLENGHWKLVNDLCLDRNEIVRDYPARVEPMRFVYPHYEHDKHGLAALMIGSWLYWTLGRGFAGRPRRLGVGAIRALIPQMRAVGFDGGLQYYDARMIDSDARLTLDILFDAMGAGLAAANYLEMKSATRADGLHVVTAEDASTEQRREVAIRSKWVVNATGCWADPVNERLDIDPPFRHLFSKGIHIVIKKIETHDRALTCLAKDGRPFFVIPWGERTLVGTTDTPYDAPPGRVQAEPADVEYLRAECEAKFDLKLDTADILNTKAGLRPLLRPAKGSKEDFLALARSHKVWADEAAAVTSVWGGKYTSCFSMGEEIARTIRVAPSGRRIERIAAAQPPDRIADAILDENGAGEESLRIALRREMVVTLEDLLRRRTNIALKEADGGRGEGGRNDGALHRLESAIRAAR